MKPLHALTFLAVAASFTFTGCEKQMRDSLNDTKKSAAEIYVNKLNGSLMFYELMNAAPPSTAQGLRALVEMPTGEPRPRGWKQQEEKIELDPWGMEYRYEFPGKHNKGGFDVYSSGPDGKPGTADDIGSW